MTAQNYYQKLAKRERLSLFLQAADRGDFKEMAAVRMASPHISIKRPDFYEEYFTLHQAMFIHLLSQFDRLMVLVLMLGQKGAAADVHTTLASVARSYLVNEKAWKAVCTDYGFGYERIRGQLMSTMLFSRLDEAIGIIESMVDELDKVQGVPPAGTPDFAEAKGDYERSIAALLSRVSSTT